MKKGNGLQLNSSKLRCRAEEPTPAETSSLLAESQRLVHELQVSKFELEMQNDELRRAWNERQEVEALLGKYSDHYDFAPVGYFNLDSAGLILAVNFTGADILGATHWSEEVDRLHARKFEIHSALDPEHTPRSVQVFSQGDASWYELNNGYFIEDP